MEKKTKESDALLHQISSFTQFHFYFTHIISLNLKLDRTITINERRHSPTKVTPSFFSSVFLLDFFHLIKRTFTWHAFFYIFFLFFCTANGHIWPPITPKQSKIKGKKVQLFRLVRQPKFWKNWGATRQLWLS